MDFFAQQDRARAGSRRLIVLYSLALAGVIVTLNVVGGIIWFQAHSGHSGGVADGLFFLVLNAAIVGIIAIATAIKSAEIGGDGAKVAELLGGRPIVGTPDDLGERRLINVVEEMSLASGVPTPRVYVLDHERGINAFAAGATPDAAVVAVTRGTLDALSRDQLQGVVAHEFSHILNGDMRLNLRLISLNFGIMAIGYLGLQILRFSGSSSSTSSSRKKESDGVGPIVAFAIAMAILGYVGTLFGKMLQAAVSRKREYLADASAVQFTRNPDGIAGALKRIGGIGSTLAAPAAGEASHLFFAGGVAGFLDSLFATHPPLEARIRAIDPSFDGKMTPREATTLHEEGTDAATTWQPYAAPAAAGFAGNDDARLPLEPARVMEQGPNDAAPVIAAIPDQLRVAAREAYDARAIVLASLLDRDERVRGRQLAAIARADDTIALMADRYRQIVDAAGPRARLPIVELSMPALRQLSTSQRHEFRTLCRTLAAADQVLSPFELSLFQLVDHTLPDAAGPGDNGVRFASVGSVAGEIGVLLSVLAAAGGPEQARRAFDAGVARLRASRPIEFAVGYDDERFARALATLRLAATGVRRRIVDAAAHTVAVDGVVRIEEMELLRAACAAFDMPVPPLTEAIVP